MSLMGDKSKARRLAKRAGLPIVPGQRGTVLDEAEGLKLANEVGFPVMIKAAAGGGGKGMRVVHNEVNFGNAFLMASAEAQAAFGVGRGLHREVHRGAAPHRVPDHGRQARQRGRTWGSATARCSGATRSSSRRLPRPALTAKLRREMGDAAVRLATHDRLHRRRDGGVPAGQVGRYYFIEMNTRIQVEHPVTEMITGIDLVKEQIRVAAGRAPVVHPEGRSRSAATPSSAASTPRTRSTSPPAPG